MSFLRCRVTAVSLTLLTSSTFAQDPAAVAPPPPPPPWVGAAQVSFLKTSGNTETSVLGLGVEAKHKGESPWSIAMKAAVNRGSVAGEQNLNNLMGSLRAARALNERTDLFAEAAYARDTFAGIDSRIGGELGIARRLSISEPHLLTVEAGLGFAHEVRLPAKRAADFATGRAGLTYKYVISKTSDFQNQASAVANLSDSKDWRFTNLASLTAAINSRFSLKLSHALSRFNFPPAGKKKTDTAIAAALVAKF